LGAAGTAPFIFKKIAQLAVIGQAGELIGCGQKLELFIGQAQLFGALGNEAFEFALAVAGLTEPVAHKSINRPEKRQNAESVEPPGPPERRHDADRERGSSFIPEAIAVRGFDPEGVTAGG